MKIVDKTTLDAVPLQAGTFEVTNDGPRLIASRCTRCNGIFFPVRTFCGKCSSRELVNELLSPSGTISAFSLIDRKSALSRIEPPYVQACVAMPEGLNVYTVLAGIDHDDVKLGMTVKTAIAEIDAGDNGIATIAYVFGPATDEVSS